VSPAPDDWEAEADAMVRALGPIPPRVAEAMRRLPRHRFVEARFRTQAYEDEPLPIGTGETTISAPHMVAFQLEWAELVPGLKVLEVGSGSGYLLALVAELVRPGGRVIGLEIDGALAERSERLLREFGHEASSVEIHSADGSRGWLEAAPYDRILVSAAAPSLLPAWREQLAPGGLLIAPVGTRWEQRLVRYRSRPSGPQIDEGPAVRFVALTSRAGR
jgi:protein-L-isoaspartate(D-aspartate) O-methyltransferase